MGGAPDFWGRFGVIDKLAGELKVEEEGKVVGKAEDEELGSSLDADYFSEKVFLVAIDVFLVINNLEAFNSLVFNLLGELAADGFHFRQFGHNQLIIIKYIKF